MALNDNVDDLLDAQSALIQEIHLHILQIPLPTYPNQEGKAEIFPRR